MQLVTPEHQAFIGERLRRRIIGELDDKSFEFEIRHRDGHRLWLELTTSGVHDAGGKLIAIQGVARDITRRKETDAERATLAAIVQNSEDAIISKSLEGIVRSWNGAAERLFGYSAAEAVGRPIMKLIIPPDHQDEERDILAKIFRGERVVDFDTVRMRKDGTLVPVSLTVSPIRGADWKIIGASKSAREIRDRKSAQE